MVKDSRRIEPPTVVEVDQGLRQAPGADRGDG
jgi:hypothetical protein